MHSRQPQPAPTPEPRLLSLEEIAAELELESPQAFMMKAEGDHRSGRTTYMLLSAVQELLLGNYVLILAHDARYTHILSKQLYIYALKLRMSNIQLKEQLINYHIVFPFSTSANNAKALEKFPHVYSIFIDHYQPERR